jgi:predicted small lipoprotein YifL
MYAKRLLVLFVAIALAACAATGPMYSEQAATTAGIPPQSARLTVFRTAADTQHSSRSAVVRIDGKERGSCEFAGFQTFYVLAGHHALTVELSDWPGKCSLSVDVMGGEEYFFEVAPRTETTASDVLWSVIGFIAGLRMGAPITPIPSTRSESTANACGGAFSINGVEESVALQKLKDLRMSR